MRRLPALIAVALVAAACGGGSKAPATTPAAPTQPKPAAAKKQLHVSLTAQSHHPKLGHTWTYTVRVTDAQTGKPVPAHIHLQFLFGGIPVGEVGKHDVANGVWTETIPATGKDAFPPAAVGQHVTLHAAVTAKGYKPGGASWAVTAVR